MPKAQSANTESTAFHALAVSYPHKSICYIYLEAHKASKEGVQKEEMEGKGHQRSEAAIEKKEKTKNAK